MGFSCAAALFPLFLLGPELVEMRFEQVFPAPRGATWFSRSLGQDRAVILIHGLLPHPISESLVAKPGISGWEKPGSSLVSALGQHADVFAMGYGQNATIDEIACSPALFRSVRTLKSMGYREIVLVGHSAGALIARYFVEDWPDEGVTKVVQVCPPNGGSSWGNRTAGVRQGQEAFVTSMTKEARAAKRAERADRRISTDIEFVCVVGMLAGIGDGVVRADLQWTDDLQDQGVPAVVLRASHVTAMRSRSVIQRLVLVVSQPQTRWSASEVEKVRQELFGSDPPADIKR